MAAALALTACPGDPYVRVHVCGDVQIPGQIDALRLTLFDETQQELFSAVRELFVPGEGDPADAGTADAGPTDGGEGEDGGACTPGTAQPLPRTFDLHAGRGQMWLVVEGLLDGVAVVRADARVEQPVRGVAVVSVGLQPDCLGVRCAYGQTCAEARCQIAVFGGDPDACAGAPPDGTPVEACRPEAGP